jgi:hypothetical protein
LMGRLRRTGSWKRVGRVGLPRLMITMRARAAKSGPPELSDGSASAYNVR